MKTIPDSRLELNPVVQRFRRMRRDQNFAVLEGFHAVKHALRFGAEVQEVIASDPAELEKLTQLLAPDLAGEFAARATLVTREVLAGITAHVPHTGVVALARRPKSDVKRILHDSRPRPIVLLEDPRDLGNLGACIRVAAAADATAVITTGSNDPWHPNALRGAAGLHYALPVARVDRVELGDRPLVAVDPDGEVFDPGRLDPRSILAFGTERYGLSATLLAASHQRLAIPMREGVSSLNLATSVAAILFTWAYRGPRDPPLP